MTTSLSSRLDPRADRLATWSAVGGLIVAVSVAIASGNFLYDQPASDVTPLAALGVTIALVAPFVAALAAQLVRSPVIRRAVWLVSGVFGLMFGVLTLFSGVGFFFIAAAGGLLGAWWLSRDSTNT